MGVECGVAKSRRWRWTLYLVVCLVGAGWCYHDGWMTDKYKDDPGNLMFNRVVAGVLAGGAAFFVIGLVVIGRTRVIGDDKGIDVNGRRRIAWNEIDDVDDSRYQKGLVTVHYTQQGQKCTYMIDSYKVDHFDDLLDEISRHRPDVLPPAEEHSDPNGPGEQGE